MSNTLLYEVGSSVNSDDNPKIDEIISEAIEVFRKNTQTNYVTSSVWDNDGIKYSVTVQMCVGPTPHERYILEKERTTALAADNKRLLDTIDGLRKRVAQYEEKPYEMMRVALARELKYKQDVVKMIMSYVWTNIGDDDIYNVDVIVENDSGDHQIVSMCTRHSGFWFSENGDVVDNVVAWRLMRLEDKK